MITQLTAGQEAQIPKIVRKWLDYRDKPKPIDLEKMIEMNEWLYSLIGKPKPITLIARSPLEMQLFANLFGGSKFDLSKQLMEQLNEQFNEQFRGQLVGQLNKQFNEQFREQLWGQLREQIEEQLNEQFNEQFNEQLRNKLWEQLREQLIFQLREQLSEQLWEQLSEQLSGELSGELRKKNNMKYYSINLYGSIDDAGWVSFYSFIADLPGIKIDPILKAKLKKFEEYLECGVLMSIQMEGLCIVCPMPSKTRCQTDGRLHCEDGSAVEFEDGYKLYCLDGIRFDRKDQDKLYWKIVKHELTLPEILAIEDIDQRAVALKYCNAESIINDLVKAGQAELVDSATKQASYLEHNSIEFVDGVAQIDFLVEKPSEIQKTLKYDLYKVTIPDVFDEPEFLLVYPHASVDGLSYWKGVDPETAKEGSIASIAKYHNMSLDEYLLATSQS